MTALRRLCCHRGSAQQVGFLPSPAHAHCSSGPHSPFVLTCYPREPGPLRACGPVPTMVIEIEMHFPSKDSGLQRRRVFDLLPHEVLNPVPLHLLTPFRIASRRPVSSTAPEKGLCRRAWSKRRVDGSRGVMPFQLYRVRQAWARVCTFPFA